MLSLPITHQKQVSYEMPIYLIDEDDFFEATKVTINLREIDSLEDVRRAITKTYYKDHSSMQFYIFDKQRNSFSSCTQRMEDALISLEIQNHEMLLLITDKPPLEEYGDCARVWFDLRFEGWSDNKDQQRLVPFKIFHFPKKVKVETLYCMVYRWMYRNHYFRTDDFYQKFSQGIQGLDKETRPFHLEMRKRILEFDALSRESEEIELEQEQIVIRLNDLTPMRNLDLFFMTIRDYRDPVVISHIKITSCLDYLTAQYSLDEQNRWKCAKCSNYEKAVVNLSLKKLPDILIIHFKRFRQMDDGSFDKVDLDIQFPLQNLDLAKYLDRPEAGQSTTYDLFAAINHRGSLQRGHYVALIHHFKECKWFKFDDEIVSEVRDPWSSGTDQPYILFYKRTNRQLFEVNSL